MKALPVIYLCKTKEELLKQFNEVNRSLIQFYKDIPEEFYSHKAIPDGWTVERNIKHSISTNKIFTFWMSLPKFFLKLVGKPRTQIIDLSEIDPTNRHGISSYGKYEKTDKKSNPQKKETLLKDLEIAIQKLILEVNKKSEEELDNFKGPLGGMSFRAILYFLLKHDVHHAFVVRKRLEETKSGLI